MQELARAQSELAAVVEDYQTRVRAQIPAGQAAIASVRSNLDLARSAPVLDKALGDLYTMLPSASAAELGTALEELGKLPNGDLVAGAVLRTLALDPRVDLYSRRQAGIPTGLERVAQQAVADFLLMGLPSFLENRRLQEAPGISEAVRHEAQVGQMLDYAGFLLNLAGPLAAGARKLAGGGRTAVEMTPEIRASLRAAGYTDAAIADLSDDLSRAASNALRLDDILTTATPGEAPSLLSRWADTAGSGAYFDDADRALKLGAGAGAGTLDAWTLPNPARWMIADPAQNGALSLRGTNAAGGVFFGSNRRIDGVDVNEVIVRPTASNL